MSVHAAVAGVFFALGLGIGLWGGAAGAILARAGVDPAAFGVILTLYTGVYLAAMSAGGALAHRFGPRRVLTVSACLFGAALCGLLDAVSGAAVAGFLIASGLIGGVVDVTMNAEGARIERLRGQPIFARLHAAASVGIGLGAILGSLLAASPAPWLAGLMAFVGLAGAGLAYDRAARREPAPLAPPPMRHAARGLSFTPALIGLGLAIGVSVAAETAATVWSSLLLRDEAPRLAAIAGLGAGFFAICQAALRFNADRIRLKVSDGRIIVSSFAVAALGFGLAAAERGLCGERRGLRPDRLRHGRHRALQFRPGGPADARPAGRRPRLGLADQHADPPAGPAGDRRDRPACLAARGVRRLRPRPGRRGPRDGPVRTGERDASFGGKA